MRLYRPALLVLAFVLLAYLIAEAVFRVSRYEDLKAQFAQNTHYQFSSFAEPIYRVDRSVGYAYLPNTRNRQWLYDRDGNLLPHESHIAINNAGMMLPANISLQKQPNEFRIAILGDSFCATTTSDVNWPMALQEVVNSDSDWRRALGRSKITVLNFGLDGTGLVQWPDVYRNRVGQFDPDLVIVNFISDDIVRKYVYRDTLSFGDAKGMFACTSAPVDIRNPDCRNGFAFVMDPTRSDPKQRSEQIKRQIYDELVRTLPWYSPYPELLAWITKGRIGLHSRLQVAASRPGIFGLSHLVYDDKQQAMDLSLAALKQISALHHPLLVLHHPMMEECMAGKSFALAVSFIKRAADLQIVDMVNELPKGVDKQEIERWYNVPYDNHPSNYGAKIYAAAVEKQIKRVVTGDASGKHATD